MEDAFHTIAATILLSIALLWKLGMRVKEIIISGFHPTLIVIIL